PHAALRIPAAWPRLEPVPGAALPPSPQAEFPTLLPPAGAALPVRPPTGCVLPHGHGPPGRGPRMRPHRLAPTPGCAAVGPPFRGLARQVRPGWLAVRLTRGTTRPGHVVIRPGGHRVRFGRCRVPVPQPHRRRS